MPESPDREEIRWAHELKIRGAERAHDNSHEFFNKANEAAVKASELALRTAILVNGGAAIAILAFVGGIASKNGAILSGPIQAIASTLIWFSWGIVTAALAIGCAYGTNYCIAGKEASRIYEWDHPYVADGPKTRIWFCLATIFQLFAVALSIGSLLCFVFGILDVRNAISLFR